MCKKLYKCSCFIEVREHKRSLPIITGCQDFFALGRNFNLSPLFRRRHRRLFQKRPHLLGARNWRGGRPIFIGTNQSHINQSLGPTPRKHFFQRFCIWDASWSSKNQVNLSLDTIVDLVLSKKTLVLKILDPFGEHIWCHCF